MQKYFIKLLVVQVCFTFFIMATSSHSAVKNAKEDRITQARDIGIMIGQGKPVSEIEDAWMSYLKSHPENTSTDAALQQVLEAAILEADKELQQNMEKAEASDSLKDNIKAELNQERVLHARSYEETVSRSASRSGSRSGRDSQGDKNVEGNKGLGSTLGELNQYVGAANSVLNTLATDPNLANTGIQNTLQEHQNTLQLISAAANVLYQIASPSPGQQSPGGYPNQQDQGGYPNQQGQMGYPDQQGQQGYPGQQGQQGYPNQQGLMGQWQQSGYSSSLLGCWQCRTMSGPASFIFKSESLLIYNGELANYTLVPGAFRVFEGGITVDYNYELRQNNLLVTLPDGSYIQCMRMNCR